MSTVHYQTTTARTRPQPDSWEDVLYQTETADKLLLLDDLRSIEAVRPFAARI